MSPKVTFGFSLVNSLFLVMGEANFSVPSTSLTVGGFNQPSVVRNLIELPVNAEKEKAKGSYGCSPNQCMVVLTAWNLLTRLSPQK